MLLKGEIEEEDIGENGLLWEAMEFEIVSDKEGELFFFIDSHVDAIKFLTAMVKVDTELSSKSKKFIKRGLLILKKGTAGGRGEFVTSRFDHATHLARAFTCQDDGSHIQSYVSVMREE